jgi:biotin operon repressor
MSHEVSQEIRRFILTSIPSVPYLEAILLLRLEANTSWSGATLARLLYISEAKAEVILAELKQAGIVVSEDGGLPGYRYLPASNKLREQIDTIAAIYPKNVIEITNLIHSSSKSKVQQFADAFKLRKDT